MTPTGTTKDELKRRGRKLVRVGGKQVLLIAHGEGVFAIANRCPHEGYPLSEGTLGPSCVVTCNWHNWKFDLATGQALIGFDPVRTFPVALRGTEILVDLTDPPAEAQRTRALAGLEVALDYDDRARMARETARLERAGYDARLALTHAIMRQNARLEGGMTHAHAAAPDWLSLAARAQDPDLRLTALLEPISHLARDTPAPARSPMPRARRNGMRPLLPTRSSARTKRAPPGSCAVRSRRRRLTLICGRRSRPRRSRTTTTSATARSTC